MSKHTPLILLAIIVLISLGTATQMADAFTTNGAASEANSNTDEFSGKIGSYRAHMVSVDGTNYSNEPVVSINFYFIGKLSATFTSVSIDSTNGAFTDFLSTNYDPTNKHHNFYFKFIPASDGPVTITLPANSVVQNTIPNPVLSFSFIYDTTDPQFATSSDTADAFLGDTIPTLECTDANPTTVTKSVTGTFDALGIKNVEYSCTDAVGNFAVVKTVAYSVTAPLPPLTIQFYSDGTHYQKYDYMINGYSTSNTLLTIPDDVNEIRANWNGNFDYCYYQLIVVDGHNRVYVDAPLDSDTSLCSPVILNFDSSLMINDSIEFYGILGTDESTETLGILQFNHLVDTTPTPPADPPKKKKSSSNNDYWTRAPTFGSHHQTYQQQVDYGFTFNGQKITIENNYHVDIDKINAKVGNNTATIKVFAQDPLRNVSLYLGIPTNLDTSGAETQIELVLYKNNTVSSGYTVKQVNHHQEEPLIDETATYSSTHKVNCNDTDTLKKCHSFIINFRVMAPLMYDHTAITAYDVSGRSQTTFINDGIEFHGAQLSEPKTHTIHYKLGSQHDVKYHNLEQTDRRNNIWMDQHGHIYTHNAHNTWKQLSVGELNRMGLSDDTVQYYSEMKNSLTPVSLTKTDPDVNVVTRIHSSFGGMIQDEKAKALQVFDTTKDLKQYTKATYIRSINDTGITSALSRDDSGFVNLIHDEQSKALIILGVSPQDQDVFALSSDTPTKVTYDSETYVIALGLADGIVSSMTRDDSGFESLLQAEHDKAMKVIDATALKLDDSQTYSYFKNNSNIIQIIDREDPGFQKLLQDEYNKALLVFDARDLETQQIPIEITTNDHSYSGVLDINKIPYKLLAEQHKAQQIIDKYNYQ